MATIYEVNLRNYFPYVDDGATGTGCIGEAYPTTRNGLTFGYDASIVGDSNGGFPRDRGTTAIVRLLGVHLMTSARRFDFDLPEGPGTYVVRVGAGSATDAGTTDFDIKDGSTVLATIAGTIPGGSSINALGNVLTDSAWQAAYSASGLSLTFSGSKISLQTRAPGSDWGGMLQHVSVESTASAPTISSQPSGQSVTSPSTATFSATITGTYTGLRWQRQAAGAGAWADIGGATSTSYTTGATSVSGGSHNNTDRYRLQVDWSGGTVTSTDVALTVTAGGTAPAITVQPTNQSVTTPATATFSVTATGSGTKTYQWQRQPAAGGGYTNISGAVSSSYTTGATAVTAAATTTATPTAAW